METAAHYPAAAAHYPAAAAHYPAAAAAHYPAAAARNVPAEPVIFKLDIVLPQLIQPNQLKKQDEFFAEIKRFLHNVLPTVPITQQIEELDLSLPATYSDLTNENPQFHYDIIFAVMEKFKMSKTIKFPTLKLDALNTLLETLKLEQITTTASYKCIHLSLAKNDSTSDNDMQLVLRRIVDHLLPCKPKEINLHSVDCLLLDSRKLSAVKTFLTREIPNVLERPTLSFNDKLVFNWSKELKDAGYPSTNVAKKGKGTKPKKKMTVPPTVHQQVFTYDCYEMLPHCGPSQVFTAYNFWNLGAIHKMGYTGRGIKVALIDTGINKYHPAFKWDNIVMADFFQDTMIYDAVGHGTFCAGLLCGQPFEYLQDPRGLGNKKGVFPGGVAPDVSLIVCKVTRGTSSVANSEYIIKALETISQEGVDVVALPMGSSNCSPEVSKAIGSLVGVGVVIVCPASIQGNGFGQRVCFPGRSGKVLCIGSHDSRGRVSPFFSSGQEVDFLAPGEGVSGPTNSLFFHQVAISSGTSYSVTAVAGLVCLLLQWISKNTSDESLYYLKNQLVVKEVLRKISASPEKHTAAEGYKTLHPLRFFQRPHEFIQEIVEELYEPSASET